MDADFVSRPDGRVFTWPPVAVVRAWPLRIWADPFGLFCVSVPGYLMLFVVQWRNSIAALRAGEVPPDLGYSASASRTLQLLQAGTLAFLCASYLAALVQWDRRRWRTRDVVWTCGALALLGWTLVPANSSDVLEYIGFGRLVSVYHLNPYTHSYSDVADQLSSQITWDEPMPYGPLVLPVFSVAGWLSTVSVLVGIQALKSIWLLLWVGNACLVFAVAEGLGLDPTYALFTVAANPAIVFEQIGNAHNDGLLMLGALLAVWCLQRRHHRAALLFAAASTLVKTPGLFVLAGVAVVLVRRRAWPALLQVTLLVAAGTTMVCWLFPGSLEALTLLNSQWHYSEDSLHTVVIDAVNAVHRVLGWDVDYDSVFAMDRTVATPLFIGFCAWRYARITDVQTLVNETGRLFLALLLLYAVSVYPWYAAWAVPFGALSSSPAVRRGTIAASVALLGLYAVPSDWVERVPWHPLWSAMRLTCAFGVPLAIWLGAEIGRPISRSI